MFQVVLPLKFIHKNWSFLELLAFFIMELILNLRYYRAPELIFGATDYTTSIGKQFSCIGCESVFQLVFCLVLH